MTLEIHGLFLEVSPRDEDFLYGVSVPTVKLTARYTLLSLWFFQSIVIQQHEFSQFAEISTAPGVLCSTGLFGTFYMCGASFL